MMGNEMPMLQKETVLLEDLNVNGLAIFYAKYQKMFSEIPKHIF